MPDQNPQNPWDAVGQTPSQTPPATNTPVTATSPISGNPWDAVTSTSTDTAPPANTPQDNPVAKHGILSRAWNWVTSPIADTMLLPKDIKTSDIIKAAAFEKMFGEAYIPGINDFDTKAEQHLNESAGKHAVKTFISGVAKDASDMAASFTSPVGIATTLAGVGPEAKAGSVLAKAAPVAKVFAGTAFGAKGASDIYGAGTENTPEAWEKRLQGAAQIAGGAGFMKDVPEAVETVRNAVDSARDTMSSAPPAGTPAKPGIIQQIRQGRAVNQPGAQAAVRSGVQASVDTTNAANEANAAKPAANVTQVDKYPVSVEHDAEGNVINADGRHRVVEAWERGDKTIPVTTKLADGTTTVIEQTPQAVAKKMGLGDTVQDARDAITASDEQQGAVRVGNGKSRTPVYETPAPQASPDMTPVKSPAVKEGPLVSGHDTVVDEHLSALSKNEQAAYKKMDDAAGFDVKAEKASLANDNYKLKQLGNTDADVTQRGNLIESINDSTDRIAEAEAKMKAAGIDPDAADTIHKQRMAGQDFRKSLVKNTNPVDGSVRIKGLLNDAKSLRNSRYGDRLEQFFGSKEAADAYMSKLAEMDRLGAHAVKARWVAGILGASLAATAGLSKLAHAVQIGAAVLP